jgi:pyruvate kinase
MRTSESKIKAIVTMPPYAPYIDEVLQHPYVLGIRLNIVMPLKETKEETLLRLQGLCDKFGKQFWVDLKGRQLRVKNFSVAPYTAIELSHEIEVITPCRAYFSSRNESAVILETDGNKLIMQDGPRRVIGPGESVTIPHPSLEIKGLFPEEDLHYIEAAKKAGVHQYMLSFVESSRDSASLLELDAAASIVEKIESERGISYVRNSYDGKRRLMAARGDMFLELPWPHRIIEALELIVMKDSKAIAASRIFDSLAKYSEPTCEEIGDFDNLIRMGYKTTMLGDEVCFNRDSVIAALNLMQSLSCAHEKTIMPK